MTTVRTYRGIVLLLVSAAVVVGEPIPGDVYREYVWNPGANIILHEGPTDEVSLPGTVDLGDAVKAEAVVEFANVHLMVWGQALQVNGSEWIPVPFPPTVPNDPFAYFNMVAQTVPVPLAAFKQGANTFRLKVDEGKQKGWTQIYGVTFRVYYDSAKKPHAVGKVLLSPARSAIGKSVKFALDVQKGHAAVVDYIGHFENVDLNGNGLFSGWQYSYFHGQLVRHIGSATMPPFAVTWDTSWVPDQGTTMQVAARIQNNEGLFTMSQPVEGLTFSRRDFSVELCKPTGVPAGFTSCCYGTGVSGDRKTKAAQFNVTGDLSKAVVAQLVFQTWKRATFCGIKINEVELTDLRVEGSGPLFIRSPLNPLGALKSGTNVLELTPAKDGGADVEWPGVQVLIQYSQAPKALNRSQTP